MSTYYTYIFFSCISKKKNFISENRQADKRTVTENSSSSCSSSSSGSYSEFDDSDADPDFCDSLSSYTSQDNQTKQPEENQTTKSRKRTAAPGQWKRNRAKILRNSGKPYKSLKKNVDVAETSALLVIVNVD